MKKNKRLMNTSFVSLPETAAKERARKKRQAMQVNRLARVVRAARAIFV